MFAGCTSNLYTPYASTTSDEARIYAAKQFLDEREYRLAITEIEATSAGTRAERANKILLASAYAGECGMEFFTFFEGLSSADFGSGSIFAIVFSSFTAVPVLPASCVAAEQIMSTLAAGETLESDDQLFAVLINMAKMGTILRSSADADGLNNTGNGTVDPGWNACEADSISNDDVAQVLVGFSRFLVNVAVLGATLGSDFENSINGLTALCADTPGNPLAGLCDAESTDEATPHIPMMRILLQWQNTGIGNCAAADAASAVLTCCP